MDVRPGATDDGLAAPALTAPTIGGMNEATRWRFAMSIGGFHAHTSTFLVATMERYLREVVDQCSLAPAAQTRLFSLQHGITVKGEDQVERWRAKAAAYPDDLQRAMLDKNLRFGRFRHAAEMLAARDDVLALCEIFVETGRQLLGALLGLNRIYVPAPGYLKSMDETIELMAVKPPDLSARLKRSFRIEPTAAVEEYEALIEETLALVEKHVPGVDTTPYRAGRRPNRVPLTTRRPRSRRARSRRAAPRRPPRSCFEGRVGRLKPARSLTSRSLN